MFKKLLIVLLMSSTMLFAQDEDLSSQTEESESTSYKAYIVGAGILVSTVAVLGIYWKFIPALFEKEKNKPTKEETQDTEEAEENGTSFEPATDVDNNTFVIHDSDSKDEDQGAGTFVENPNTQNPSKQTEKKKPSRAVRRLKRNQAKQPKSNFNNFPTAKRKLIIEEERFLDQNLTHMEQRSYLQQAKDLLGSGRASVKRTFSQIFGDNTTEE